MDLILVRMPVPGWAVCNHKVNDAILYIIPGMNKAALVMRKELKAGFEKRRFPDRNRKYAKNGRYRRLVFLSVGNA